MGRKYKSHKTKHGNEILVSKILCFNVKLYNLFKLVNLINLHCCEIWMVC